MGTLLTPTDLVIFFGSLIAVMAIGLWAGRKEEDSEDYYLAGRGTRWWGVAGSIFGSNISANHIVGMMGVGFALGFVESHFEIGAIAGLLLLCYGFLPVYRRMKVFTLSEYLAQRYDDASRVAYAVIMVTIIVVVMMVPAFYIGSRSLNILLVGQAEIDAALQSAGTDNAQSIQIDFNYYVVGILLMAFVTGTYTIIGGLKAVIITDVIQSLMMLFAAFIVAIWTFSQPEIGGWAGFRELDAAAGQIAAQASKMHLYLPSNHPERPWTGVLTGLFVLHFYYWGTNQFIVQRALAARSDREARLGIITAGFFKLLIPFVSIGTGIAAFYLFRERMPGVAVDADTAFPMLMRELIAPVGFGLMGLVAAGLIGAILSSVDSMMNSAATLLTFDIYKRYVKPDATEKQLIWFGRLCIAVFVVGSALLTVLIMDPNTKENFFTYVATHQSKLIAGLVVAFALGMWWKRATAAGGLAAIIMGIVFSYTLPPIYDGYIDARPTDGIVEHVIAFPEDAPHRLEDGQAVRLRAHKGTLPNTAGEKAVHTYFVRAIDGTHITLHEKRDEALEGRNRILLFDMKSKVFVYPAVRQWWVERFDIRMNFFHSVFLAALLAAITHVVVSLCTSPNAEKAKFTWTELGGHDPGDLGRLAVTIAALLAIYVAIAVLMVNRIVPPLGAAMLGAWFTMAAFTAFAFIAAAREERPIWKEDRLLAGVLASCAIFMMYYFY